MNICRSFAGVRTVNADRHPGDAAGRIRDRPRLYLRHQEAAADDNQRGGEGVDTDVSQFARPTSWISIRRPTDVRYRIRGNGADVQHQRRGLESKTNGVRLAACARHRGASALLPPGAEPSGTGRVAAGLRPGLSESAAAPSRLRPRSAPPRPLAHVAFAAVGGVASR